MYSQKPGTVHGEGAELKAECKNPQQIFDIRVQETVNGTLKVPEESAASHVYYGSDVTYSEE